MTAQAMTAQQHKIPAGGRFGLPGFTYPTEQRDNNDGVFLALSRTNTTSQTGLVPFKQVDVVLSWSFGISVAQSGITATTVTTSPQFPYNYIGQFQLSIQNMYSNILASSGWELALFQFYRPMQNGGFYNALDQNPTGLASPSGSANIQTNLVTNAASATNSSGTVYWTLDMPVSCIFDVYYDLDVNGNILAAPSRAIVSPQYMMGSARFIQPQFNWNPISSGGLDASPYNLNGSPAGSATGTIQIMRQGYYGSDDPSVLPPVYNWQYVRQVRRQSLSGRSSVDLPLNFNGQILSLYAYFWDPAANSGLGAAIDTTTAVVNAYYQFGNLYAFQDRPFENQRRVLREHNLLLPKGMMLWDSAFDNFGRFTNSDALNTLNTSSVMLHFDFNTTLSASAYVALGIEGLVYVEQS